MLGEEQVGETFVYFDKFGAFIVSLPVGFQFVKAVI
jgi:hypothetical protein